MARGDRQLVVGAGETDGAATQYTAESVLAGVELGKLTGRMEMAHFCETVSQKVLIETYLKIKEGRKYIGLPLPDGKGKCETIAQFCDVFLGKTARRMQQLEASYTLLGPELYEKAETIGLTSRDYAAIRALPADEQRVIKEALEDGDKDRLLATLQDLSVKHSREMEAMKSRLQVAEGNDKAAREQLKKTRENLDQAEARIAQLENYTPQEKLDFKEQQIRSVLQHRQNGIKVSLDQLAVAMGDYLELGRTEAREGLVEGALVFVAQCLYEVAVAHGSRIDFQQVLDPFSSEG